MGDSRTEALTTVGFESFTRTLQTFRDILLNGPSLLGIDIMERVKMELTKQRVGKETFGESPVTYIHITAPLAAGKSTVAEGLVRGLSEDFSTILVRESVENNKALSRSVSKGPLESLALDATQTHFTWNVYNDMHEAGIELSRNGGGLVVVDQSPTGHKTLQMLKAKHDGLSGRSLSYLNKQHDQLGRSFNDKSIKHINIVLLASPQDLEKRVEIRGRDFEQGNPIYQAKRQSELQNTMFAEILGHRIKPEDPYYKLDADVGPQGIMIFRDRRAIVINTSAPGMSEEGVVTTALCYVRQLLNNL